MIWIIGGGPRSHQICSYLNVLKKPYKLTTITDYKRDMPLSYTSKALSEPLSEREIETFIKNKEIHCIIDHSYEVGSSFSKLLIKVCEATRVKYIRYEEQTLLDEVTKYYEKAQVIVEASRLEPLLEKYESPILMAPNRRLKRMFKAADEIVVWVEKDKLTIERLIQEIEKHQIKQVVVSEDENLKAYLEACKRLDIPITIIKRNKLQYPIKCYSLEKLKEYLQ